MKKTIFMVIFLIALFLIGCYSSPYQINELTEGSGPTSESIKEDISIKPDLETSSPVQETENNFLEKGQEIYACDFTKSICNFEINIPMQPPGSGLLEGHMSDLSISEQGVTAANSKVVSFNKEIKPSFSRIDVTYDGFEKPVGNGDSILTLTSQYWGWYHFFIDCPTSSNCELHSLYFPTNRPPAEEPVSKIELPDGEFTLTLIIVKDEDHSVVVGHEEGLIYINNKFIHTIPDLFDATYYKKDRFWINFGLDNSDTALNKFRLKKIALFE